MILIILSAAILNSSLPLTRLTGSKRTNWIAVIATRRCKASREAYSVLPGFFSEKRWQGMANSRLSAITTCGRALHHGGTYAQVHRHPDTVPSLSLRNRLLPASPGI